MKNKYFQPNWPWTYLLNYHFFLLPLPSFFQTKCENHWRHLRLHTILDSIHYCPSYNRNLLLPLPMRVHRIPLSYKHPLLRKSSTSPAPKPITVVTSDPAGNPSSYAWNLTFHPAHSCLRLQRIRTLTQSSQSSFRSVIPFCLLSTTNARPRRPTWPHWLHWHPNWSSNPHYSTLHSWPSPRYAFSPPTTQAAPNRSDSLSSHRSFLQTTFNTRSVPYFKQPWQLQEGWQDCPFLS